jgi:ssDNA-binding Zn-finger/Zn-ribbon topoisomerase 1
MTDLSDCPECGDPVDVELRDGLIWADPDNYRACRINESQMIHFDATRNGNEAGTGDES